jgi:hypothetical protein
MKSLLTSLATVLVFVVLYWFDVFGLFAQKGALAWALGLVAAVFIAGFFFIGNPLAALTKENKDED